MTPCEAIRSRLEELRVDLLPASERDAAETHLSACPGCASRMRRIQDVEKALIESAEPLDVGKIREVVRHAKDRVAREKRRKEILPMAAAALLLLSILAWLTGLPGTGAGPAGPQEAFEEKLRGTLPTEGDAKTLQWSPDGRHWACKVKVGDDHRMDVDGRKGNPFQYIGEPYFSADGRKLAYVAADESRKLFVVVLDVETGETTKGEYFDDVTGYEEFQSGGGFRSGLLRWSPAGASLAYIGRRGNQSFAIVDGAAQGPYGNVYQFAWSPDGKAVAYIAVQGQDWFVVRDGKKGEVFDHVSYLKFNPDGRSLAFVAQEGHYRLIWGNQRGPGFSNVGRPVFSPDGKRVAYATPQQVLVDGAPGAVYASVGDPVFSPDGTVVAHKVKFEQGERIFLLQGGSEPKRGESYTRVGKPVFSPDGKVVAYPAWRGEKQVMVVGNQAGEKFSRVDAPVFSPDGRVVAFSAERYGKEVMVVGDQVGEEVDRILWGPVFSADGKKVSYRARKGQELWSKVVDVP